MQINPDQIKLEASWKEALLSEFSEPYFAVIKQNLIDARNAGQTIFPPMNLLFNAFEQTPFHAVRVVILGQDPYHQPNQAMGLSFSVPKGVTVPPSLRNIYKELAQTYPDFKIPNHGDLSSWANQGVLLLNSVLTVEANKAGSHSKWGWQRFTDAVIQKLSAEKSGIIFLLWGNYAKAKADLIQGDKHHILTAVHPSPLAGGGFVGCRHFQKVNEILSARGDTPIQWQV